ncbi:MAG: hypothetical protein QNJ75_06700 [Acidimicrobiia bacterium]|nr:hypothetical protein [Acidimicrobiia bacterium]
MLGRIPGDEIAFDFDEIEVGPVLRALRRRGHEAGVTDSLTAGRYRLSVPG